MKQIDQKISNVQLAAVVISTIIGIGVLSLPSTVAKELGNDGWILIAASGIVACFLTYLISVITRTYPRKTLVEFGRELVTTPISDLISIIFCIYLVILGSFEVRLFAEVSKMFLLNRTPTEVIIITMLLSTSYIARYGIEGLSRMALLIIPIVIIPLFFLFLTLIPEMDFTNIFPMFRFKFINLIKGIPTTFFSFIGFEFLLIFMAFVDKPKESARYNVFSVAIVTVIYILVFFVTLLRFGSTELHHQIWPTLSLMKIIEFPGAFIENIEGIVMALWVLAAFTSLGPLLYIAALILSKVSRVDEHSYFVLPIIPIIYFLALIPDSLAHLYTYMDLFSFYLGTFITVIIPVIFIVIILIKKRRKRGGYKL
jgi:spore germination protein